MIVGGYTLDLYCDRESKAHEYKEFPHEYTAELGSVTRRNARRDGWVLNMKEGTAICPKCSGKGPKPKPPQTPPAGLPA